MDLFDQTFFTQGDDVLLSPDNTMIFVNDIIPAGSSWTSVNQNQASPTGTVSPTDLSLEPSLTMSAPSSTAFPNLSTPGSNLLDSPWAGNGSSSLDTSPLHPDGQLDSGLADVDWATQPLFPTDPSVDPFAQNHVSNDVSGYTESSPMSRQKSSPGRSTTHGRKHSEVAGVKPSKSRKPLPDIVIDDDDDKEIAKRKKNTAAARKSRDRKLERAQEQDVEIAKLSTMLDAKQQKIEKLTRYIIAMGGSPQQADLV